MTVQLYPHQLLKKLSFCLLNCPCTIVKDQLTIFCMAILGFPGGTSGKVVWIPGWVRSPGGGLDNPLQYSCLENPIDRGAWQATYSPWSHKELDVTE